MRSRKPRTRISTVILIGFVACMLFTARGGPTCFADDALDARVERARASQDAELRQARKRDPKRGVYSYAQEVVKRAIERPNDALLLYMAGRAAFYAGQKDHAATYMRRAHSIRPDLWHAALSMAQLSYASKSWDVLDQWLAEVYKHNPESIRARDIEVQGLIARGRHADAIPILKKLVAAHPTELRLRALLAESHFKEKDAKNAIYHLEKLRGSALWNADARVRYLLARCYAASSRWDQALLVMEELRREGAFEKQRELHQQYVFMLWQAKRTEDFLREAAAYVRVVPKDAGMWAHLEAIYATRKEHTKRVHALRQLLTLAKDDKARKQIAQLIKNFERAFADGLKDGDPLPDSSASAKTPSTGVMKNSLMELMSRCIHKDVKVRRAALREYYEYDIGGVYPIVYTRFDHSIEPDPECRIWALKILGRFGVSSVSDASLVQDTAWRLATALTDPDSGVRRIAAEEIGNLGVKSASLYVLPYFFILPVTNVPSVEEHKKSLEAEYNAARLTLRELMGFRDTSVGEEKWIKLADAAANRSTWETWLSSPAGSEAKLEAIQDIKDLKARSSHVRHAHWLARYLNSYIVAPGSPPAVARAAYKIVRDARVAIRTSKEKDTFFSGFPVVRDAELTDDAMANLGKQIQQWRLAANRRLQKKAPRAPADPPAGFPGSK